MMKVFFSFVWLAAIAPLGTAEPQLSVGFAEADISPTLGKKPVYMAGFGSNRTATKIHDPILARAVVLSDGTKTLALVSVDLVGFFLPNVENIRKELKGIDHLVVSSTHNHEGPDTVGLWGASPFQSGVDAEYLKGIEATISKVVGAADKSKVAAKAKIGTANAPELINDNRLPEVKHDELVAIRFEAATGGKLLGILIQWNCHPETLDDKNREITADFVGYAVSAVKKKHDCPVAYFTGTVGGLMTSLKVPIKNDKGVELKDGTFDKAEAFGNSLAKVADKALTAAVEAKLVPFDLRVKTILVPVHNALYKLAKTVGVLNRPMFPWAGTTTPKDWKEAADVTKPVGVKTEVAYLKLGELDIAAIPGEIYPELVLSKVQDPPDAGADFPEAAVEPAIYAPLKGKFKMLLGLANDELGYFIPKRQWDAEKPYCYKLKSSQYGEINSCGPDAAAAICDAFRTLAEASKK